MSSYASQEGKIRHKGIGKMILKNFSLRPVNAGIYCHSPGKTNKPINKWNKLSHFMRKKATKGEENVGDKKKNIQKRKWAGPLDCDL